MIRLSCIPAALIFFILEATLLNGATASASDAPIIDLQGIQNINRSLLLSAKGDALLKQGSYEPGKKAYSDAAQLWANNTDALYGIGLCAREDGDHDTEAYYYRLSLYTSSGELRSTNTKRLLQVASNLIDFGDLQDAARVYNDAVNIVNSVDDKPRTLIALPKFDDQDRQVLRSLVSIAQGIEAVHETEQLLYFRAAVASKDTAVGWIYLGAHLLDYGNVAEGKAALQRASRLDNSAAVNSAVASLER